ncbi:MAG: hypothetical protein ABR565_03175 [Gammaproteobacteria bacterium]
MNTSKRMSLTAAVLGIAFAGVAGAQQDFPAERVLPSTCNGMSWHNEMVAQHPRVIAACQEVVHSGGTAWGRFHAKFNRVNPDGQVSFGIHDQNERFIEDVTLLLAPGQVAYINDRPTEFNRLPRGQVVSLYVPNGQYGFATMPGAPPEQIAVVAPKPVVVAAAAPREPMARMLPRTAGPLPLLALGGLFALIGGLGLTMRRKL